MKNDATTIVTKDELLNNVDLNTFSDNVLEITTLSKNFGAKHILNEISFNLKKGKVLGILGPNGQGKTTLLNVISGLFKPTLGTVTINGMSVGRETKQFVSYLQEKDYLFKWMKVNDALKFYKDFFYDFNESKALSLLKFMNIQTDAKLKSLSKGMLEKVALSLTLSRNCNLYILDEPISGVDIISRDKIINAIIDNLDSNASMIITTHYVGELEQIFDEVIFLGDGSIIEKGDAEELRIKYGTSIDKIYRKVFAE
ncbi:MULTISPECIES: ABC transporter ATP-binding protein [Clostridium]|uniref:ABC transporter ATP-binding protein n=1 Tax=Clostridium TaxID=1485 RepID=UPI000AE2C82F|nr:ABC transporter ATP-binding protein [Clostridium sulfidigenes]